MKRTSFKFIAPFFLAGTLIGLFLTMQLRSEVIQSSSYPLDEYNFQMELIETFQNEQSELQTELNSLNESVQTAQEEATSYLSGADSEYLAELQKQLGLTELSGQGVAIIFGDNADRSDPNADLNALIHASDLRDIVNLMRALPYEGLAINGQRIVHSTAISGTGNTILVNHLRVTPPFEIEIVTNVPESVIQALTEDESLKNIYARVASVGLEFKFKKEELIWVPAYVGGYRTNFLNAING